MLQDDVRQPNLRKGRLVTDTKSQESLRGTGNAEFLTFPALSSAMICSASSLTATMAKEMHSVRGRDQLLPTGEAGVMASAVTGVITHATGVITHGIRKTRV